MKKLKGIKHDGGKPRLELIPDDALEEVARVLEFGLKTYGEDNWKKGLSFKRLIGAMKRHIADFNEKRDFADDSKLHNIAHAVANGLFILWLSKHMPECDDRNKKKKKK